METFEEKKLRQCQEKLDKFGVDTHPSLKLKVFEHTGRGLTVTTDVVKGTHLLRVPTERLVTPRYIFEKYKVFDSYMSAMPDGFGARFYLTFEHLQSFNSSPSKQAFKSMSTICLSCGFCTK